MSRLCRSCVKMNSFYTFPIKKNTEKNKIFFKNIKPLCNLARLYSRTAKSVPKMAGNQTDLAKKNDNLRRKRRKGL